MSTFLPIDDIERFCLNLGVLNTPDDVSITAMAL